MEEGFLREALKNLEYSSITYSSQMITFSLAKEPTDNSRASRDKIEVVGDRKK